MDSFFFFHQNSNCSLNTFFSRPRAGFTSHHHHVDIGIECHKCICFQTCNHDTRDDADNHTTIFFILPSRDKGLKTLVARLAFRLFELSRQSVPSLSVLKRMLALGETSLRLPLLSTKSNGVPWHACVENYNLEQDPIVFRGKRFSSLRLGERILPLSLCHDSTLERFFAIEQTSVRKFTIHL